MNYSIEHIIKAQTHHGEGPLWDPASDRFYWVDILKGKIQYAEKADGFQKITTLETGEPVGMVGLTSEAEQLIAALKNRVAFIHLSSAEKTILAEAAQEIADTRFNDGKVGPDGRLYAGTMADGTLPVGNFYRFDGKGTSQLLERQLQVSNGLDWSEDHKTLYLTDSPKKLIYAYDFDVSTGNIENRRIHIDSTDEEGEPDGLCIDRESCIWSARWGAFKVVRYDPAGKKMSEIKLPVPYPTSCCFGGENLSELFITSSPIAMSADEKRTYPESGNHFIVPTEAMGYPPHRFQL